MTSLTARVPVLTYHSNNVDGTDYPTNDHIGLAEDLELIHQAGYRVISLERLIQAVIFAEWHTVPARSVVITLDDGSLFDWKDLSYRDFGTQRSMVNILRDFRSRHGHDAQPELQATSFVIGSPKARQVLETSCLLGQGWMSDEWWRMAHQEGLLRIANHSWDHRHESLPPKLKYSDSAQYGQFADVEGQHECDWQIRQTQKYLTRILGDSPAPAFAYPFGHVPDYLADNYFPANGEKLGLLIAMTTEAAPVTSSSSRWRLPRYVFRRDWQSPDELMKILKS